MLKFFICIVYCFAWCTDRALLLKSHDFLPFTDFFVARKMKDFLLSQYPINAVVILWVSSLAKRYVSNNATGCDSDSIFFFNFFALLTLKDLTIYTLQYITRTKKK